MPMLCCGLLAFTQICLQLLAKLRSRRGIFTGQLTPNVPVLKSSEWKSFAVAFRLDIAFSLWKTGKLKTIEIIEAFSVKSDFVCRLIYAVV